MAGKKQTSLDRVLGRLDSLDPASMTSLVQRLARERNLYEGVFNTLQEGVLVIDAEGEIEYANTSAHQLIGLTNDDLPGKTLWRLVPGLRPSLAATLDAAAPALPVMTREIELTYPEPRTIRLYMVPVEGEGSGAERRFAVILTDITRDKRSTEARIEDERTSSILLLAGGVAHELGNPLNSLTIHLQLIERRLKKLKTVARDKETESLSDSIRVCQEEVLRLDGIVTHFLEAIRPRPPDLSETNLADIIEEVLRFQQRELEDRGIELDAVISHNLPAVMADRNQLKQVFFNIIKNAMEAMQPGGVLRIKTRADDESVYLLFGDNGSGIKQEDLVKLFQPYHTTKEGGHGLGLMIVQRIMREHGGQVGVESNPGVGTVFTLQFPQKNRRVKMLQ
ncbi:MAG: ATP-binding protein [Rariglobus sp.]